MVPLPVLCVFIMAATEMILQKNMRVAYRATLEQNKGSFHLGIRLVCNADPGMGSVSGTGMQHTDRSEGANY